MRNQEIYGSISKYYISGVGVNNPPDIFAANKDRWAELPSDLKRAFDDIVIEYTKWMVKSEYDEAEIKKI